MGYPAGKDVETGGDRQTDSEKGKDEQTGDSVVVREQVQ